MLNKKKEVKVEEEKNKKGKMQELTNTNTMIINKKAIKPKQVKKV